MKYLPWAGWAVAGAALEYAALRHHNHPTLSYVTRVTIGRAGERRSLGNLVLAAVLVWFFAHIVRYVDAKDA